VCSIALKGFQRRFEQRNGNVLNTLQDDERKFDANLCRSGKARNDREKIRVNEQIQDDKEKVKEGERERKRGIDRKKLHNR
jgi:hypothetical protein